MTKQHSRRDVLRTASAGLGLTISPSILSDGVGAIERISPKSAGVGPSPPKPLPAVRSSVLYLRHPDAPAIASPTDRQFVFLEVTSRGLDVEDVPSATDFVFRVDDEQYRGGWKVAGLPLEGALMWDQDLQRTPYLGYERWHETKADGKPDVTKSQAVGNGVLVFAAPMSIETDDVAVELQPPNAEEKRATWMFDTTFIDALQNPPSFEITTFEVPNRVERGVKGPVSLSVQNTGGRTDIFAAVFGLDRAEHPNGIEFPVPTGEEVTWNGFLRYPPTFEDVDKQADQAEYVLDLGHTRLQRSVEIVD